MDAKLLTNAYSLEGTTLSGKVVNIDDYFEKPVTPTEKYLARALNYNAQSKPDYEEAGNLCRTGRELQGLTSDYVSSRLGISKERLERFESGGPDPEPELLYKAYGLLLALEAILQP